MKREGPGNKSVCFLVRLGYILACSGNCRKARGLKSKIVFRLFRFSNERSTKFKSLYQEYKYLEEENGKDLYGNLQTLRGSHLSNFPRKTLKIS